VEGQGCPGLPSHIPGFLGHHRTEGQIETTVAVPSDARIPGHSTVPVVHDEFPTCPCAVFTSQVQVTLFVLFVVRTYGNSQHVPVLCSHPRSKLPYLSYLS